MSPTHPETIDLPRLREKIERWARELGFQSLGISSGQLTEAESHLLEWLGRGYHGTMTYMSRHGSAEHARMNFFPARFASSVCAWIIAPKTSWTLSPV